MEKISEDISKKVVTNEVIGSMEIGALFSETVSLYKKKFWQLLTFSLAPNLVLILTVLVSAFLFYLGGGIDFPIISFSLFFVSLSILGISFLSAFVFFVGMFVLISKIEETTRFVEIFKIAKERSLGFFFLLVLFLFLIFLWSLLFVVPGLIFLVFYSMSSWVFFEEGKTGWSALKRSKELVSGKWFAVAGRFLLVLICFEMVKVFIDMFFAFDLDSRLISSIISIFTVPFFSLYSWLIFKALKKHQTKKEINKKELVLSEKNKLEKESSEKEFSKKEYIKSGLVTKKQVSRKKRKPAVSSGELQKKAGIKKNRSKKRKKVAISDA